MKEKRLLECNASETRKAESRNPIQMTVASVSNSFFYCFKETVLQLRCCGKYQQWNIQCYFHGILSPSPSKKQRLCYFISKGLRCVCACIFMLLLPLLLNGSDFVNYCLNRKTRVWQPVFSRDNLNGCLGYLLPI